MRQAIRLRGELEEYSNERRQMEYRLQELAERDGLTELPNRPLFEQELAGHVLRARVRDESAATGSATSSRCS